MGRDRKKIRKVGLYILCGALTIFILMMFLSFNNITEIFDVVRTADFGYVCVATVFLLAYAILSPLTLCILARSKKSGISFGNAYMIGMTEHFFNGITPFSTGGQPFQVYAFNKYKVKPAESTGLLLMNFIIHMLVTNAFAICSLFYYRRFASSSQISILAIVGFTMNFLVLVFMISLATSKRLRALLSALLLKLAKIKFLNKFLEPKVPQLNTYFEQVQDAFKQLWHKKGMFFLCIAVKIVTMAFFYAITFYILRALNINVGYDQMFFIICGTSFAITMVVFLPTPGSSGGIEFAFKSIFASIAGVSSVTAYGGMLIWRLLSYYLLMVISLIFYVALEILYTKRFRPRMLAMEREASDAEPTDAENVDTPTLEDAEAQEKPITANNNTDNTSIDEEGKQPEEEKDK